MSSESESIGVRIRKIRKLLRMNQGEFAEPLDISVPGLSDLENGKYRPGHDFLRNIAQGYNVNLYYLMFGKGPEFIQVEELFAEAEKKSGEPEDVKEFLYYFHASEIVKYHMLSEFNMFYQDHEEKIRFQIERKKKEAANNPDNTNTI